MNKTKKNLCGVSGAILIILGLTIISIYLWGALSSCLYYRSISGLFYMDTTVWILLIVSFILLVIPGIKIFSFKESARKLAIFSYGALSISAAFYNCFFYMLCLYLPPDSKAEPRLVNFTNLKIYFNSTAWIGPVFMFIIPLFFLVVLLLSQEEFSRNGKQHLTTRST